MSLERLAKLMTIVELICLAGFGIHDWRPSYRCERALRLLAGR
jgi:hypothetical protein